MAQIERRDNPTSGLHDFYITDNGEEYLLLSVKPGRVVKQKRLAAERQKQQTDTSDTETQQ